MATLLEWKKFVEGLRRGTVGPYKEELRKQGQNVVRVYLRGNAMRGRMTVENALRGNSTRSNVRNFFVHPQDITATNFIYVPTDEDIEQWNDDELDIAEEISKRESRSPNNLLALIL